MSSPNLTTLELDAFLGEEISGGVGTRPPMFQLDTLILDDSTCNGTNKYFLRNFALILGLFSEIGKLRFRIPNMPLVAGDTPPDHPVAQEVLEELVPNPGFVRIREVVTSDTDPEYGGPTPFGSFMQILHRSMKPENLVSFKVENWLLRNPDLLRPILNDAVNLTHLTLTISIRCEFFIYAWFT